MYTDLILSIIRSNVERSRFEVLAICYFAEGEDLCKAQWACPTM